MRTVALPPLQCLLGLPWESGVRDFWAPQVHLLAEALHRLCPWQV